MGLLDSLRGARKPVNPLVTSGVSGTVATSGYLVTNEKSPNLVGQAKYITYSEFLANTSIIAAGVRYFLNIITKSSWKLDTPDDSPEAKRLAELVEEIINDMETPWHRVIRKSVMYKFYGFSVQEWTAKKRDDGSIGLRDIESRPQRTITRWDLESSGKILGVVQQSPEDFTEIYLPRNRLVYVVDDSLNDSPEGLGLFRHVVDPANRLKRYEQLEGFGFETDLRGIPVGRAPLSEIKKLQEDGILTAAQATQILAPLKDFIENHIKGPKLGLLIDSKTYESANEAQTPSNVPLWNMELLKGTSNSLKESHEAIQRVNHEIARILGVEGLLLGGQGRGSMALSTDKSNNFYITVDGAMKELAASFSKDVIDPLWLLNGWDPKLKPKFKTDSISLRDIEQITGALKDMAQAGAVLAPDDPAINEVRDLMGLSRSAINEDLTLTDETDEEID